LKIFFKQSLRRNDLLLNNLGAVFERRRMHNESGFLCWLGIDLEGRKLGASVSYCKGLLRPDKGMFRRKDKNVCTEKSC